jgi:hypothetical protein
MIKPPKWAKGAYPTTRGWMRGNELLISTRISQADVNEWHTPEIIHEEEIIDNHPVQPPQSVDIGEMGKEELEEFARIEGIELDRRRSLKNMAKDYWSAKE